MKVGSSIVATELELYRLGIDIETLKSDLTLPNPEFANRMRFGKGRFYGKVDTHICYLKKSRKSVYCSQILYRGTWKVW